MNDGKKFLVIIGLLGVVLLILFYSYAGITGRVTEEITVDSVAKIGFVGQLTGDSASYGRGLKSGVDLALEDSGLKNVKIIYEDSDCNDKEVVNAIDKLIDSDNVLAIISAVCPDAELSAARLGEANNIAIINVNSVSQAYDAFIAISDALKKSANTREEIKNEINQ